jgi:hypothetical protein
MILRHAFLASYSTGVRPGAPGGPNYDVEVPTAHSQGTVNGRKKYPDPK